MKERNLKEDLGIGVQNLGKEWGDLEFSQGLMFNELRVEPSSPIVTAFHRLPLHIRAFFIY